MSNYGKGSVPRGRLTIPMPYVSQRRTEHGILRCLANFDCEDQKLAEQRVTEAFTIPIPDNIAQLINNILAKEAQIRGFT